MKSASPVVATLIAVAFAAPVAVAQTGRSDARAAANAIGQSIIRGRVIAADSGRPLKRAQVRAVAPGSSEAKTMTDANGRYELALPPGRYVISASKPGFLPLNFGQRRPSQRAPPVQLEANRTLERADFSLVRGGVIAGHVVDEAGEPAAGATIQALQRRFAGGRRQLVPLIQVDTNDLGEYRLYGLPAGQYYVKTITARDDTARYAPTFYPSTHELAQATVLSLTAGEQLSSIVVTLSSAKTSRLVGRVVDSTGRPVAGGRALLRDAVHSSSVPPSSSQVYALSNDGRFTIPDVPPGDYVVEVSSMAAGWSRSGENAEFGSSSVNVRGDDLQELNIVTHRGGTAEGQIVLEPGVTPTFGPESIQVFARAAASDSFSGWISQAPTGGDWRFRLAGLVGVQLIRPQGLPPQWYMKAVYLGSTDITYTPINFDSTDHVEGITIVLTDRAATVGGLLTTASGQPTSDATVLLFSDDARRWQLGVPYAWVTVPGQNGQFSISGLPRGRYRIVALDNLDPDESTDPEVLARMHTVARTVELQGNEQQVVELSVIRRK